MISKYMFLSLSVSLQVMESSPVVEPVAVPPSRILSKLDSCGKQRSPQVESLTSVFDLTETPTKSSATMMNPRQLQHPNGVVGPADRRV